MLLAVIADTHLPRGRRALPLACVERLVDADLILHAGDFVTGTFLRELEELGPPVVGVHGNVDEIALRHVLPPTRTIRAGDLAIALVHDAGPSAGRLARLRRRFPAADAAVFGHSHAPLHERDGDGFQIFNPGSPTERRRSPHHTMGLAHVDGLDLRFELVTLD